MLGVAMFTVVGNPQKMAKAAPLVTSIYPRQTFQVLG